MKKIEHVRKYWNRRPCNIRHSQKPLGTREYFDEVEKRKYFVEPHIPAFAQFERWRGKKVLEIGFGIGTDTINFARADTSVTTVELSDESLKLAKQRADIYGLNNITFYSADAEELSKTVPVEKYDLVYSFGVIHHTPHPERVLEEIRKYCDENTEIKIMLYSKWSWKVFWIILTYGRGRFWQAKKLIPEYSEAQTVSPVSHAYSFNEIRLLMKDYEIISITKDHIFPYIIVKYKKYIYQYEWYFKWMPRPLFRWLEKRLGWHTLITAKLKKSALERHSVKHSKQNVVEAKIGREVFFTREAFAINRARLSHLASLGLDLAGKEVLEVGGGVGLHTDFFEKLGCKVMFTDARADNIAYVNRHYPHRQTETIDLDAESDLKRLGTFDVVYCYGTLYHLSKPEQALKELAKICREKIFIETCVALDGEDTIHFVEELRENPNQSFYGVGCRPTRSWVMARLKKYFGYAYATVKQPTYPDFVSDWTNPKPQKLYRAIFVGSKQPISNPNLSDTLLDKTPQIEGRT